MKHARLVLLVGAIVLALAAPSPASSQPSAQLIHWFIKTKTKSPKTNFDSKLAYGFCPANPVLAFQIRFYASDLPVNRYLSQSPEYGIRFRMIGPKLNSAFTIDVAFDSSYVYNVSVDTSFWGLKPNRPFKPGVYHLILSIPATYGQTLLKKSLKLVQKRGGCSTRRHH